MSRAMDRVIAALRRKGCRQSWGNWTCPAHEDLEPSLSVSEGDDGRVLLCCQAGCATEAVLAALELTWKDLYPDENARWGNGKPVRYANGPGTIYEYQDESGQLLFQVVRGKPKNGKKVFWQQPPDGQGGWIKGKGSMDGVRRVLFRLPELLSAGPDLPVFLVEGEKDALNVAALGLTATTNPGGAGKWKKCEEQGDGCFSEPLRGRHVVILPDNDKSGRRHAADVAQRLRGVAASTKIVQLPGLPEKGDVSDWLSAGGSVEGLKELAGTTPPRDPKEAGTRDGASPVHMSQAKLLVRLAQEVGIELFHDQRDEPYAVIGDKAGRRILAVGSKDFGLWLRRLMWKKLETAPTGEVITIARQTLGSLGRFDGPKHELSVRCAVHDRAFWIDLDGSRALRVTPGRWEVVNVPPTLFRSFSHQRPLPEPIRGGDPLLVLRYVNLRTESDRLLFLCYLVAGLVPGIPITALIVHGVQGSAKTTLLKVVKHLLDPSAVAVRGGVRDQSEFALAAFHNRALFFDNLTTIPDWLSDALCRTVTGEGWSKRTLYTDEDATVLEYRGLVGLSGINLVADRADLLDRSLILELEPVAPHQRLQEREFWRNFEAVRPHIFGGLLDALSRAMQVEPGLMPRSLPRMADFARWGTAAAVGLGLNPLDFLRAYESNVGRQNQAAIDSNPVAQAVLSLMADRAEWKGSPGELLDGLEKTAQALHISLRDPAWPKNPSWLTRRIRQVQPNLLAMGVEVQDVRLGQRRTVTLKKHEHAVTPLSPATSSQADSSANDGMTPSGFAVTDAVIEKTLYENELDRHASNDSISAALKGGGVTSKAEADLEAFEERAAIREFDGELPRAEAERRSRCS